MRHESSLKEWHDVMQTLHAMLLLEELQNRKRRGTQIQGTHDRKRKFTAILRRIIIVELIDKGH